TTLSFGLDHRLPGKPSTIKIGSSLSLFHRYSSTDGFVLCGRWWIPSPTTRKRATAETTIDNLSNEDLIQRLEIFDFAANTLVHVPSSQVFLGSGRVWRFTSDCIIKSFHVNEGYEPCTMEIVSTCLDAHVHSHPQSSAACDLEGSSLDFHGIHRRYRLARGMGLLALWKKLWVAWTLRCSTASQRHPRPARGPWTARLVQNCSEMCRPLLHIHKGWTI
ncbi:hypothetical protein K438DRAFT_2083820, partial [Mycena galopus ATCC 62051]